MRNLTVIEAERLSYQKTRITSFLPTVLATLRHSPDFSSMFALLRLPSYLQGQFHFSARSQDLQEEILEPRVRVILCFKLYPV